jgi:hypothetical protein
MWRSQALAEQGVAEDQRQYQDEHGAKGAENFAPVTPHTLETEACRQADVAAGEGGVILEEA